jgi:hypothetical protein
MVSKTTTTPARSGSWERIGFLHAVVRLGMMSERRALAALARELALLAKGLSE